MRNSETNIVFSSIIGIALFRELEKYHMITIIIKKNILSLKIRS